MFLQRAIVISAVLIGCLPGGAPLALAEQVEWQMVVGYFEGATDMAHHTYAFDPKAHFPTLSACQREATDYLRSVAAPPSWIDREVSCRQMGDWVVYSNSRGWHR